MTTLYNRGLDRVHHGAGGWPGETFKFLLLNDAGYVVNRDHDFVANLTPGTNEISGAGYSRVTAAGKTRTIDDALDRITYTCTDPDFGAIAIGENVTAMVLYEFVTNDADSVLIAYYPLGTIATNGLSFVFTLDAAGLIYTDQGS